MHPHLLIHLQKYSNKVVIETLKRPATLLRVRRPTTGKYMVWHQELKASVIMLRRYLGSGVMGQRVEMFLGYPEAAGDLHQPCFW